MGRSGGPAESPEASERGRDVWDHMSAQTLVAVESAEASERARDARGHMSVQNFNG